MKSRAAAVLLALLAIVFVWAWTTPVHVQVSRSDRWEYCRLVAGDFENGGYQARIEYYVNGPGGFRVDTLPGEGPPDEPWADRHEAALRRAIALLGASGWEMIGMAPVGVQGLNRAGSNGAFYFKRRVP